MQYNSWYCKSIFEARSIDSVDQPITTVHYDESSQVTGQVFVLPASVYDVLYVGEEDRHTGVEAGGTFVWAFFTETCSRLHTVLNSSHLVEPVFLPSNLHLFILLIVCKEMHVIYSPLSVCFKPDFTSSGPRWVQPHRRSLDAWARQTFPCERESNQ